MNIHEFPAGEFIKVLQSFRGRSDFLIPKNGLKDIIDALEKVIKDNKGKVLTVTKAKKIVVEDGVAQGVVAESKRETLEIKATVVISNVGPKKTIELAGAENFDKGYLKEVAEKIRPGVGMDYLFTTDKPLLDFSGTLYTIDARRTEGWSVPTLMWAEHAPKGKHLLHTMPVPESTITYNPRKEFGILLQDLKDEFPKFEEYGGKLLLRRNFCGEWPVTRSWQGYDVTQKTPVENLYNVGDGVKPSGWIVGSGSAESARIAAQDIKARIKPQ